MKRLSFLLLVILAGCNFPIPQETPNPAVETLVATMLEPTFTPTTTVTPIPTNTPFPTDTPTPILSLTPVPTEEGTYTVSEGETLIGISARLGLSVYALAVFNQIKDENLIFAGQKLLIPNQAEIEEMEKVGHVIVVQLSTQKLFAYEGDMLVGEFLVSTGVSEHPTRVGDFAIYVKHEKTRMKGDGYDLADVPWTMYYDGSYGIHGTYWHNNFGNPMSHGCVNMRTEDAEWLYHWAPIGTPVRVIR